MPDDLVYAAVIHVKINPEFNLYLDSEGCIVYVEYLNEDAADLFETVDLTGQKLADGMETIVGAAEEKGYLTGQNEVTTDVVWVQENCLRTLWRFAWKAVLYLSWQGCDHG